MMDQYISELLYRYDSIMLPGLGAFVLQYQPASVHPIDNKLAPPAKQVSFDTSIKINDGILANHIAEKEKIPFFDACAKILDFVESINSTLDQGKQVELKKVGTFSKTTDGCISFSPDTSINYNLDSFGMEEIVSAPILREDIKERIEKQFAEERPRQNKEKRWFPKAAIWILIIVVVFGGGIGALLIIKPDFVNNIKLSGLFRSTENQDGHSVKEHSKILADSVTAGDSISADTAKLDTTSAAQAPAENVSSAQQQTGTFYVIAASFRIKENADNYVQTLSQKGYNPKAIFLQDRGLFVVSYNSYSQKAEAEQALSKIITENPVAWILNN